MKCNKVLARKTVNKFKKIVKNSKNSKIIKVKAIPLDFSDIYELNYVSETLNY